MKQPTVMLAALLFTVCATLSLSGCDRPDLMPWHEELLEGEFSAAHTGEIDSFEKYLALEDKLFAELDRRFYANSATGPEYALERYSRGSLADPGQRHPNWNRSFELSVDAATGGVLLLHGMSDAPYSLRALGEALQREGYVVVGLRMPGHGTVPSGMLHLHWQDMAAVVRLGMTHLAERVPGKPLHIIGYSTGGPLALDYALQAQQDKTLPEPSKLVLISPAIGLHPTAVLAQWSRRLSLLPGLQALAWLDIQPEFDPYKYNSFTTNAAEQVFTLTQSVAQRIAQRNDAQQPLPPILVFKSTVDATVSNNALIDRLLAKLAPNRHELVLFDVNRFAPTALLLRNDPGPFTARLVADKQLSFTFTLVANSNTDSRAVAAYTKVPYTSIVQHIEPLGQAWPREVFSLSHVALPFPPDDPLYGQRAPDDTDELFLGQQALQGERGVLTIPENFLLRLRHNPFYDYQEARVIAWLR